MIDTTVSDALAAEYPIRMRLSRPVDSSRFWAIPLLGLLIKVLILIPHLIIVYVLAYVIGLASLVIWIPVLFTGRFPGWAFGLVAGYLRWLIRVSMYAYGLSDAYPAFSMDAPDDMLIEPPASSSRFFAIPIIGGLVRGLLLVPHFIVLYVLGLAVAVCQLIIWGWVLFGGQYPDWAWTLVGGTLTWTTRVYGYFFGLTDRYPPFAFT